APATVAGAVRAVATRTPTPITRAIRAVATRTPARAVATAVAVTVATTVARAVAAAAVAAVAAPEPTIRRLRGRRHRGQQHDTVHSVTPPMLCGIKPTVPPLPLDRR